MLAGGSSNSRKSTGNTVIITWISADTNIDPLLGDKLTGCFSRTWRVAWVLFVTRTESTELLAGVTTWRKNLFKKIASFLSTDGLSG